MSCDNFSIVENTEKSITLSIKGTDTTLINPIMDELDKNDNVKIVRYVNIHPELEEPQLIVEVKDDCGCTAKDALIEAAGRVSEYFDKINKEQAQAQ